MWPLSGETTSSRYHPYNRTMAPARAVLPAVEPTDDVPAEVVALYAWAPDGLPVGLLQPLVRYLFAPETADLPQDKPELIALREQLDVLHERRKRARTGVVSRLPILMALYMTARRQHAFKADGTFDLDGLVRFVAERLEKPQCEAWHMIAGGDSFGAAPHPDVVALYRTTRLEMDSDGCFVRIPVAHAHYKNLLIRPAKMTVSTDLDQGNMIRSTELTGLTFHGEQIKNVHLQDLKLSEVHFNDCSFENCTFGDVEFDACDFGQASMKEVEWIRCSLSATCSMAWTKLDRCRFHDCLMSHWYAPGAQLSKIAFLGCRLDYGNLSEGVVQGMEVDDGKMAGCRQSTLTYCNFNDCDIHGLYVTAADARYTCWLRAKIDSSQFASKRYKFEEKITDGPKPMALDFADFSGTKLGSTRFQDCSLRRATFVDADISRAALKRCMLAHSTFSSAWEFDILQLCSNCEEMESSNLEAVSLARPVMLNTNFRNPRERVKALNWLHHRETLLGNLLALKNKALQRRYFESILETLAVVRKSTTDVDAPLVLAWHRIGRPGEVRIAMTSRVKRVLKRFNRADLPKHHRSVAAFSLRDLCELTIDTTDVPAIMVKRQLTPLITRLRVALRDERADDAIHAFAAPLRAIHHSSVPPNFPQTFHDVLLTDLYGTNEDADHLPIFDHRGEHMVILKPQAARSAAGGNLDGAVLAAAYYPFSRIDGAWRLQSIDAANQLRPFPFLQQTHGIRRRELNKLIDHLQLPLELSLVVRAAMIEHDGSRKLVDAAAQETLEKCVARVIRGMSLDHGVLRLDGADEGAADNVLPESGHHVEVDRQFDEIDRQFAVRSRDNETEAAWWYIALAALFWRNASAERLGTDWDAPRALRYYGMAWANLGFARFHALGLPDFSHLQQDLAERTFADCFSCAGIMADIATEILNDEACDESTRQRIRDVLGQ